MTTESIPDVAIAPARVLAGPNPFNVDPEADFLTEPRHDRPLWNESMYFAVWSPADGVGVWLHMGVVPQDKAMWWAQTFAMLPDGVVLVDRSHGRTHDRVGPDTGNLKVRCVEPLRRWTLTFDGAGQISSTAELARGLVGAGIAAPFSFEIELDAIGPVFDIHPAFGEELDWGAGGLHHEQGFRATGTLRAQGRTYSIDGVGTRDHGLGERHFGNYGGHAAVYAVWPESERVVEMFLMWRRESDPRVLACAGTIMEPGRTEVCGHVYLTGLNAYGGDPGILRLGMIRPDGSRLELDGEVVHGVVSTYTDPNFSLNGAALDPQFGDALVCDESIVRWYWTDGEVGYGNVDRGVRPSVMPMTDVPLPPNSPFATT